MSTLGRLFYHRSAPAVALALAVAETNGDGNGRSVIVHLTGHARENRFLRRRAGEAATHGECDQMRPITSMENNMRQSGFDVGGRSASKH